MPMPDPIFPFSPTWARVLSVLLALAAVGGIYRVMAQPPPADFALPLLSPPSTAALSEIDARLGHGPTARFLSHRQNVRAHAGAVVEDQLGRIHAFWYSGSREGATDVQIRSAIFDSARGAWDAERGVVTREQTGRALLRYVKKLGNPVAVRTADGGLLLFFVTVSVGGWSGSSISVMRSDDHGATWQPPRRLITSPFFNISTLVRCSPYLYADGGIGVPVYHELFAKFGEILRLDPDGKLIDKQRISEAHHAGLQPEVIIEDARRATLMMRHAGAEAEARRVLLTSTHDAGRQWSAVRKTDFPNPNSAVAALALHDGLWIIVLNDQQNGRDKLSLYGSGDRGESWRLLHQLEDQSAHSGATPDEYTKIITPLVKNALPEGEGAPAEDYIESLRRRDCGKSCRFKFSYPDLLQAQNGEIHLVYSFSSSFIKHVRFSPQWLRRAWREAL